MIRTHGLWVLLVAAIVVGACGVGGTSYALPYCLAVLSICWLTRRWFV